MKISICGDRGLDIPRSGCASVRIVGADDVEINQGVCIDLADGVHAYDRDGAEIPFTIEPSEIGCCDVGEHEITYTAKGRGNDMRPSFCQGKPSLHTTDCETDFVTVRRTVTITQADPPRILGLTRVVLPIGSTFSPFDGVRGVDDNGNRTEVTYEGGTTFNHEGVYEVTYHTSDSCGNETTATRYVIVGDDIIEDDTYPIACQGKTCYSIIECDETAN